MSATANGSMRKRHSSHFENMVTRLGRICKTRIDAGPKVGNIEHALKSGADAPANRLSRARWTPRKGRCGRPGKQSGNAVKRLAPVLANLECFAVFAIKLIDHPARVQP
jgi:hypothetical protein